MAKGLGLQDKGNDGKSSRSVVWNASGVMFSHDDPTLSPSRSPGLLSTPN